MNKPVLVVLAAGMGSRYGGMKQIDPVGPSGEIIIDYSIYDAKKAGFETVIFIIKKEIEEIFKNAVGNRMSEHINVKYALQGMDDLPEGITRPTDRVKPWGTAHAMLSAMDQIDGPFVVINADDYYGRDAFKVVYDYLTTNTDDTNHCMVGYELQNTVTENGTVARGICEVDENNVLRQITERTKIATFDDGIKFTEDDGETWVDVASDTMVSMNLWGFKRNILDLANDNFASYLEENLKTNPLKCEYFIPLVVSDLMNSGKGKIDVLHSADKWHGVTYKEDKPAVVKAMKELVESGLYPENLWG